MDLIFVNQNRKKVMSENLKLPKFQIIHMIVGFIE